MSASPKPDKPHRSRITHLRPKPPESLTHRVTHLLLAALVLAHLVGNLIYAWAYYELTIQSVVVPITPILDIVGSLSLYIATFTGLVWPPKGRPLFLVATTCLSISFLLWGWEYAWSYVAALGAACGLFGWVLVRKPQTI